MMFYVPEPRNVTIIDSTLREGLQAPGISASYELRSEIAQMLIALGVDELEAGIPVVSPQERTWLRSLSTKLGMGVCGHPVLTPWCRGRKEDILAAAECELGRIHFALPTSDLLLQTYGKSHQWLCDQTGQLISEAGKYVDFVSFGLIDAFRSDETLLRSVIAVAEQSGVSRIRLSDTVGTAMPWQVEQRIIEFGHDRGFELEFHGHNDLGLATANTLSALRAGADCVSVTLCGIGERAGNCRLEELAAAVDSFPEIVTRLDVSRIVSASERLQEMLHFDTNSITPVTGKNCFTHESGIHAHGLLKNPLSYSNLIPARFQRQHEIVYGSSSGTHMLGDLLQSHGISCGEEEIKKLTAMVKARATETGGALTAEEVLRLCKVPNTT